MASLKSVLVSHLERRVVFKVPSDQKDIHDVEFVAQEFRKKFSYGSNVHVSITFQRFNSLWGEHIDLEEDDVINDKDKLTAVITPILVAPVSKRETT